MKAVIRITGKVKLKQSIAETLNRLHLENKFSCILIKEDDVVKMGMLKKVKDYVAFGEIEKTVLVKLIAKRGKTKDKKPIKDAEKIADEVEKGKALEAVGLKSYFRLPPPKGGLTSSKKHFPEGVLGDNKKEINKLIEKMLVY